MKTYFLLIIAACLFVNRTAVQAKQKQSPNVIIVFIDDMGYGDLGCYGATGHTTPYLDKMAHEGTRFTNFYASQPVCSASRVGLLTGCYSNRLSFPAVLAPRHTVGIAAEELTMAEMFKNSEYTTACFGKWHVGHKPEFLPLQQGFDEFVGLPYSNDMWPRDKVTGELQPEGTGRSSFPELPIYNGNKVVDEVSSMADQDELTTLYTEQAVDFIDRHAKAPFFIYLAHSMGHIPLGVSSKFRGKSEQGLYGDVMMEIDWSVGQINAALKKHNIEDNTIVIFTSDNGPWLNFGNHAGSAGGLKEGKMTNWEGGQRVPFIVKWPGHTPEGTVCNKLSCTIDLLPTLASVIGGELSENKIDGVNISALWQGDFTATPRESLLYYFGNNALNGIRLGNWKLVLPHKYRSYSSLPGRDGYDGKKVLKTVAEPQLYNLMRDPGEQYNVYAQHPDKVKEMMVIVEQARTELGDTNVRKAKGTGTRSVGTSKETEE